MVLDVVEAKLARTSAKRVFNRDVKRIIDSIEVKDTPTLIESRFNDLKRHWDDVQERHERYIEALENTKTTYDVDAEDQWINEMDEIYNDVLRKRIAYQKNVDDKQKEIERQQEIVSKEKEILIRKQENEKAIFRAQQARKVEEIAFRQEVENLETMLDVEVAKPNPAVSMLETARAELKKQLEECKRVHGEYIVLLEAEKASDETAWFANLQRIYLQMSRRICQIVPKKDDEQNKPMKANALKLERMKLPLFSGNIRDYPRFRAGFVKQVLPEIESGKAAYVLKSCLSGEAFDAVHNIDDNMTKMWKRLDEKYGQPSKLVDVIVYEIKNMKRLADGDDNAFLELVSTVEKGYQDLARIDMEAEISNTGTVSLIEERLPRDIKRAWSREVNKSDSKVEQKNKFPYLLQFLQEQRKIIEYESSALRVGEDRIRKSRVNLIDNDGRLTEEKEVAKGVSRCLVHSSNGHNTTECRVYQDMAPEAKVQLIKEKRACWSCLKIGHRSIDCRQRKKCNSDGCQKFHHESLHVAHIQGIAFYLPSLPCSSVDRDSGSSGTCLLQVMKVRSSFPHAPLNVLWDGGATISLITFAKANELSLVGEEIQLSIVKVGGVKEEMRSLMYTLPLVDESGRAINFRVYGINQISSPMRDMDVDRVLHLFQGIKKKEVQRPSGQIDVLIGYEYAGYHPVREQSSEHLLLLRNQFGRCLGGSHTKLTENTLKLIQHATVHHVAKVNIEDFFDAESLGIECSPKCGSCRCGRCPIGGKSFTLKEERELKLIEEGLSQQGDHWVARYPWIRDPNDLPDNKEMALKMLASTEKRLQKNESLRKTYREQISDMVQRGVARKLTQTEIDNYDGPVYYLSHHEVLKPESASTPCRIVFNSSAKFQGHSLNSYWAKGPDLMNNLLGILVRFREGPAAFVGDIRKMYHAIKISILDKHTHRFLWRDVLQSTEPVTYVMTSVSFGDKPAGNIATVALRKTAETGKDKFPKATDVILNSTYVDDIAESVESIPLAYELTGQIDKLIGRGGFQIKHWIYSEEECCHTNDVPLERRSASQQHIGESGATCAEEGEQKVLGVRWNSSRDEFCFKTQLNFSPKIRKARSGPNLTQAQVPNLIPAILTKRMVLSQINGIYDPLGLAAPFTIRAKILMRKLWLGESKDLSWDDPIPASLREEWAQFFVELFNMEKVKFKRCVKPRNTVGQPNLVMFSDGSNEAYGTCAYVQWHLANGTFVANLLAAKSRVTPIRKTTIVRTELNGALLSKRLSTFIKKESRLMFEKEFFLVDSEIVRAMIQKDSYGFNTYAAVRIGEIQEVTYPGDWHWIEGRLNIADWITRGKDPSELGENSLWQKGPKFLQVHESEWPIKSSVLASQLPEETKVAMVVKAESGISSLAIDILRFSCYYRLLRVTARITTICTNTSKPSLKNIAGPVEARSVVKAEMLWIKEAQKSLQKPFRNGEFSRLCARKRSDGVIVVGGRIPKSSSPSYDEQELILMPHDHRVSRLYAERVHSRGHDGVSTTVSKIRSRFWIPKLRKMAKSIREKCVTCRKKRKNLESQRMGQLPNERVTPAPAWSATAVDFFGPFQTRGETNKRSRGKAYGLIFNCMVSRAVHVDVATDYSTEGFLMVLRRFVSIRGYPKLMFSDCGSQLAAADKELKSVIEGVSKDRLKEFGAEHGLEWKFAAADAPWQNGCSEALVKSVKSAIKGAIGDQVLMFSELQTVCFEASNLVNERPIGIHPTSPEDDIYLTPNHLLLGRASSRVPSGPFKETKNERLRFEFVQRLVSAFWKRWIRDGFPSLLVRQKWHVDKRNVCVGDVVMIQDSNSVRGHWKIGRVSKTFAEEDGKVRRVEVQYKCFPANDNAKVYKGQAYITIERPVQRLVVIVAVDESFKRD